MNHSKVTYLRIQEKNDANIFEMLGEIKKVLGKKNLNNQNLLNKQNLSGPLTVKTQNQYFIFFP